MTPCSMVIVWTPSRLKTLKKLRESGKSFGQIGKIMGCTSSSAVSAYHRKVAHTIFVSNLSPSRREEEREKREKTAIPTLAYVPHIPPNPKFRMKYEWPLNGL